MDEQERGLAEALLGYQTNAARVAHRDELMPMLQVCNNSYVDPPLDPLLDNPL